MIIVTGIRSGTSWTMQTIKEFYPIVGLKYHEDFPVEELNRNGYYDLPLAETINGLKTHYKGCAVKLNGASLYHTNPDFIRGVIVCVRDREDQIKSIIKSFEKEKPLNDDELVVKYSFPSYKNAELIKEMNDFFINMFFRHNKKPRITVEFEKMSDSNDRIKEFICRLE